jgi:hypothetical protein
MCVKQLQYTSSWPMRVSAAAAKLTSGDSGGSCTLLQQASSRQQPANSVSKVDIKLFPAAVPCQLLFPAAFRVRLLSAASCSVSTAVPSCCSRVTLCLTSIQ